MQGFQVGLEDDISLPSVIKDASNSPSIKSHLCKDFKSGQQILLQ